MIARIYTRRNACVDAFERFRHGQACPAHQGRPSHRWCVCLCVRVWLRLCVCVCVSARCVSLHLVCVSDASFTSYCPRRQSYTKLHTMCTVVAKKRRATTIHRDMHKIVRMDVHADMHACMYAYISAYRPLHAYIYTPTQHACTHTHTHTHRYVFAVYIVSHAVSLV